MECYAVQLVNVNITKCSFEEFQELPTLSFKISRGYLKLTTAHDNIRAEQNLKGEITFHIFFIYIT